MSKHSIFDGPTVDLEDMMAAREARSFRQLSLLDKFPNASLLSATMTIPGPVKSSACLGDAFKTMITQIENELGHTVQFSKCLTLPTGWEYYLMADLSPKELKEKMVALEEASPTGRLFDLDVIKKTDYGVEPISRTELGHPARTCLICSANAKECSRSRKHSVEEMQDAISQLLNH